MTDWRLGSLKPSLPEAKPFLKWAGGKGQLLDVIRRYLPAPLGGTTYFEPFLGAGAVFFSLRPGRAVLSDINGPLIETYTSVKSRLPELLRVLDELSATPDGDEYYARRREFNELTPALPELGPQERVRLAALFIWLNHTCYNGLYRVNRSGLFNVPFSSNPDPAIFSRTNLKAASIALRSADADLISVDYRQVLKRARRGDVVYLDPPYHPTSETSSFTSYTPDGFGTLDQSELADSVRGLVEAGCHVVLTNSSTPATRELYRDFEQHPVYARRAINCLGDRRGKVKEILVIGK